MALIKEVFIHLQGLSPYYPYVDHYTFREQFLKKAHLPMQSLDKASYENILSHADHSSRQLEGVPGHQICRATFIEILLRIAQYIYCAVVDERDLK